MRRLIRDIAVAGVVALAPAAPLGAQQPAAGTVSPGMTRAQVISALGEPITLREASGFTYVFYRNDCARTCGINDLVVLKGDSVVDAIFRSPARRYTGKSSSPAAIPAHEARRIGAGGAAAINRDSMPGKARMKPAPPNDVRPSIPTNPPMLQAPPGGQPAAKGRPKETPKPNSTPNADTNRNPSQLPPKTP